MTGQLKTRRRLKRESGAILLLVLVVSLIVGLAIAGSSLTAIQVARNNRHAIDQVTALALAEGVTETAQKRMLNEVAEFQPPTLSGTVLLGGVDYSYTATPVGGTIARADSDGVQLVIQPYEIESSVDFGLGGATVSRVADLTMTPIFQYMIFYDGDLEVLPGPAMTLGGRVHANGDIYIGSGSTLTVDSDYLRCTGELYRKRKSDGSATGGTIDIKRFGESTYAAMTPSMDSDDPDWISLALDTWLGTVQTGSHGVTEVATPSIGSIKAIDPDTGEKGYYHENAGLVIRDGQAFDTADSPIALPPGVLTEVTMYDGREGKNVTLTQIDLDLLDSAGQFPANGLIYAYRTDASSSQPNGIRLKNGARLGGALTVATEDPIYVQGDYNTLDKKPAAVIADAVNLLSNAWNDSKTAGSLPTAGNTQYNVAIVTGDVPTPDGGGTYSGGFENLPRFHERWSGRTATIRGSFIKIYDSEIATGAWRYGGDVYTAPVRDWEFDEDFVDGGAMPPFTPQAVYFRRVVWDDGVPRPF